MQAIFWKELKDNFGQRRFGLFLGLILIGLAWGLFVTVREVLPGARDSGSFLFLDMFLAGSGFLPPLLFFISFFGPIIGITLGFDAINSERMQGTLARILAQPVFRDAVFNGKFLASLVTLVIINTSLLVGVVGLGTFVIGIPPRGEEIVRLVGFGLVTTAYLAFWLALAMTASTFLRNTVASALVSIGVWLVASFVVLLAASAIADLVVPEVQTAAQALTHFNVQTWIGRVSPGQLFSEATSILLDPIGGRSLTPLQLANPARVQGLLATPISAGQSLQLVWPHIVVTVAMIGVLIGMSYVKFMREEIRA